MTPDELRTVVSVVAAVISLVALFVSFRFSKASLDRARAGAAVAEFNARVAFRKNLLDWGSSAQEALADGHVSVLYLKPNEPECESRLLLAISKLTAAIDRGRWLLPNTDHTDYGTTAVCVYLESEVAPRIGRILICHASDKTQTALTRIQRTLGCGKPRLMPSLAHTMF